MIRHKGAGPLCALCDLRAIILCNYVVSCYAISYHFSFYHITSIGKEGKPVMWSSDHVFASLQLRSAVDGTKEEKDEFVVIR